MKIVFKDWHFFFFPQNTKQLAGKRDPWETPKPPFPGQRRAAEPGLPQDDGSASSPRGDPFPAAHTDSHRASDFGQALCQ